MSHWVKGGGNGSGPVARRNVYRIARRACENRGVGMLEFVFALLVFSLGMMGLLSAQLTGKKAGFEASQRSIATSLARDILERMRANPDQVAAYQADGVGNPSHRLPLPGADCAANPCTAQQLAVFDLWQWEALLLGESEKSSGGDAGGLVSPRACITSDSGEVEVTITWRGVLSVGPAADVACPAEAEIGEATVEEHGATPRRHQLTVTTFIARR